MRKTNLEQVRQCFSNFSSASRIPGGFRGCSRHADDDDAEKTVARGIISVLNPIDRGLNVAALRDFSTGLSHNVVLEVLRHVSSLKAVQFFWWARSQGCHLDVSACDELIHKLCKDGKVRDAKFQMEEIRAAGLNPSLQSLTVLMTSYADCRQVDIAMEMFNYLKNAGKLSPESYAPIVNALARNRRFQEALRFFDEAMAQGCRGEFLVLIRELCLAHKPFDAARCLKTLVSVGVGVQVYSEVCSLVLADLCNVGSPDLAGELLEQALNSGFCIDYSRGLSVLSTSLFKGGKHDEVIRLFKKLAEKNAVVGDKAYKYVVDGICKAGFTDKALELVHDVRDVYPPNVVVYNVVINGLCKTYKVNQAYRVFEQMVEDAISPNVFTYTILLNGLCKTGKTKLALNIFGEMKKNGCNPNPMTYWTLVQHLGQVGEVDEALKLLQEQTSLDIETEVVSCTTIVNGMCKADRFEEAMKFIEEDMPGMKVEPNQFTYGSLINGLCQKDKLGMVVQYMKDLETKHGNIPRAALPAFVDVFSKVNCLDEAEKCLEEMRTQGMVPDLVTYSTLINAFSEGKRFETAMQLLEDMAQKGVKPDVVTYTSLIKVLCKENKIDEAFKTLELMVLAGNEPNVVTYNSLMDGLCKQGQMDEVHRLYEVMLKSGVSPNVVTYSIIMNGLSKSGKLDSAVKLFQLIQANRCGTDAIAYSTIIDSLCRAGKLEEACGMFLGMGDMNGPVVHRVLGSLVTGLCGAGKIEDAKNIVKSAVERGQCGDGADLFATIESFPGTTAAFEASS